MHESNGLYAWFCKHQHSGCASAPVELLRRSLWLQLFLAAGIGPLKEHFWFHCLLPIVSMTLCMDRGIWFLRSCENWLRSLQVCPMISGIGECSCTHACSPPSLKAAVNLLCPCNWHCNKLSWKQATGFWEQGVLLRVSYTPLSLIVKKNKN